MVVVLTRLLTFPWSQAFATAYTYEREAFSLVYMSAIFPNEHKTVFSHQS